MSEYLTYYTEANVICFIIFGVILLHDLFGIDRQEKQIKFDHALIAFMCYFVSDTLWAMVVDGVIPKTELTNALTNLLNYLFMVGITFTWLIYVMAFEQVPGRNDIRRKWAMASPFVLSTVALILVYFISPSLLFDENLFPKLLYNIFLITVPAVYIILIMFYALRKAYWDPNPFEKKKHIYIGLLPALVVVGGLIQVIFLPNLPIFCFCCAILILIFNILSMETSISLDPLTGLDNRGQFMRLASQKNAFITENKHTFLVMIDVNDFKGINDTYGHSEGDNALLIVAGSLKKVSDENSGVVFTGRYGGDEFILIIQSESRTEIDEIIEDIRERIAAECDSREKPYMIAIGAGYEELTAGIDSCKNCLQQADSNMYVDKERIKKLGKTTVLRR